MQIEMPPLRERGSDIQALAVLFMQKLAKQLGMPPVPMGEDVIAGLLAYNWPGNVRELRNLIERSLILGRFPVEFRKARLRQRQRARRWKRSRSAIS